MKIKKYLLIILLLTLSFNLIFGIVNIHNALAAGNFDFTAFDSANSVSGSEGVKNLVNNSSSIVITVMRIVCVGIAIVILLVISMKYMMSAPGDRADIKKHSINFVIGAIVLFGLNFVLEVIAKFAEQIQG